MIWRHIVKRSVRWCHIPGLELCRPWSLFHQVRSELCWHPRLSWNATKVWKSSRRGEMCVWVCDMYIINIWVSIRIGPLHPPGRIRGSNLFGSDKTIQLRIYHYMYEYEYEYDFEATFIRYFTWILRKLHDGIFWDERSSNLYSPRIRIPWKRQFRRPHRTN